MIQFHNFLAAVGVTRPGQNLYYQLQNTLPHNYLSALTTFLAQLTLKDIQILARRILQTWQSNFSVRNCKSLDNSFSFQHFPRVNSMIFERPSSKDSSYRAVSSYQQIQKQADISKLSTASPVYIDDGMNHQMWSTQSCQNCSISKQTQKKSIGFEEQQQTRRLRQQLKAKMRGKILK